MTDIIESQPDEIVVPEITIFSKNDCYQCRNVKTKLDDEGIPYTEINVEEDLEPRAEFDGKTPFDYVVSTYGRAMPVIAVDDGGWGEHWTGIRPDKLIPLIRKTKTALELQRAQALYDESGSEPEA